MKFSILALLGLSPLATTGMTSSPHPFNETQPDGEAVMLKIRGDPYDSYISDMEGTYGRTKQTVFFKNKIYNVTISHIIIFSKSLF
jgi:hypothetical protein